MCDINKQAFIATHMTYQHWSQTHLYFASAEVCGRMRQRNKIDQQETQK